MPYNGCDTRTKANRSRYRRSHPVSYFERLLKNTKETNPRYKKDIINVTCPYVITRSNRTNSWFRKVMYNQVDITLGNFRVSRR